MTASWQMEHPDLKSRLVHLYETKTQSDCSFLVGKGNGQVVAAHKVIVSAASAVLQQKLEKATGEPPRAIISDVEPEIFELMMKYIYTDAVNISSSEVAFKLAWAASTYELPHLERECFKFISSILSVQNVLQAYDLATCFKDTVLYKKCEEIIQNRTKEVLEDNSFLEACVNVLSSVFAMEHLEIDSELDLLKAADRYHKHHTDTKSTDDNCDTKFLLTDVIAKIRFLTLTPEEFAEARAGSTLLAETDACAILANISSEKSGTAMPSGFSVSRQSRKLAKLQNKIMPLIKLQLRVPNDPDKDWISSTFMVQSLPWMVKVKPKSSDGKNLSVFVYCNWETKLETWSCTADVELSLLRPDLEAMTRNYTKTFKHDTTSWGYDDFIERETMEDPRNKYLKDGAMILEVSIKAQKSNLTS